MLGNPDDLIGDAIFEMFNENDRLARRGQGSSSFNDDGQSNLRPNVRGRNASAARVGAVSYV